MKMRTICLAPARLAAGLRRWSVPMALSAGVFVVLADPAPVEAQLREPAFTIEEVLSPVFRYGLTSAAAADRIAWIENDRGRRNVLTASAPDFAPVRLTSTDSGPAYNIDKWTSPTLVIHGDDDRNVEFSQTIGLVSLFRARNIPHELIVYPDDTHYFGYYHRWLRAFNAIDDFFDRNLVGRSGPVMTSAGGM